MEQFEKDLIEWQNNNTDSSTHTLIADGLPAYLVFLTVTGLLTNGVLVYLLSKTNVRNKPNVFILNLAIADLLIVLFHLPFEAVKFTTIPLYPFGDFICKTTEGIYWVALGAAGFSLTALGIHSTLVSGEATQRREVKTDVAVAVVWTLAVAFAVPTMIIAEVADTSYGKHEELFCLSFAYGFQLIEVIMRLFVIVAIPLAVVSCFYFVANHNKNTKSQDSCKLALLMLVFCVLCIVPGYTTELWNIRNYNEHNYFWNSVHIFFYFLHRAYPCLCPVALFCVSGALRQLFSRHLLCWCRSDGREPVPERELALHPLV